MEDTKLSTPSTTIISGNPPVCYDSDPSSQPLRYNKSLNSRILNPSSNSELEVSARRTSIPHCNDTEFLIVRPRREDKIPNERALPACPNVIVIPKTASRLHRILYLSTPNKRNKKLLACKLSVENYSDEDNTNHPGPTTRWNVTELEFEDLIDMLSANVASEDQARARWRSYLGQETKQ
ncbi:hypothetical protein P153DRAFT_391100 [Dothidotthia symphoricarpi CBS 119687]|uniref:Uncharacterized protein n=1 Tax=Dothidotthia symphoricarpi CBS 119687 TaxID=1392245 RepID=A0A6A5ZYU9_9PLEO|nr:uncharacterized protein P153DRAFT_391100 [Dothidotthia symphoricarpi CBS 119687]KAF2124064.1 hypothetical protein P153DRAFT_391100 [Dothidotthia symphoricarpi CBS 119687]